MIRFRAVIGAFGMFLVLGAGCVVKKAELPGRSTTNATVDLSASATNATVLDFSDDAQKNQEEADIAALRIAEVDITSSGFSPRSVIIGVGGTVTWTNRDSVEHQPIAESSAQGAWLETFNALRGLATDEQYALTFNSEGTFRYRDALHPNMQGTVVVR